ncbi:MAG: hypothetical protein U0457_05490 [Candidatus Sericytochromatia bacterium]
MSNINLGGGEIQKNLQVNKIQENQKVDRQEALKDREALAGSKQVEAKHKKEEVSKTQGRYKAFKKAYSYMLGDDPNDGHVEEEYTTTKVSKVEKVDVTPEKPTLDEIEQYDARKRFKAKISHFLGDDFNEDEDYQEENLISDDKITDNHLKLIFAKNAYQTLFQYIFDSLGDFSFDRIEDLHLLIDYGMPESSIYKFLFLQQLARSSVDYPNVMDISILMYKMKKIGINIDNERLKDIINDNFETLKKVKYTLASFVYIPLQEVLDKIEYDLTLFYQFELNKISEKLNIEPFLSYDQKLDYDFLFILKEIVNKDFNLIEDKEKEIRTLELKLKLPNQKNIDEINQKIINLREEILNIKKYKNDISIQVTKYISIYYFLNSKMKIVDFNKNMPIDMIKKDLIYLDIDINNEKIKYFFTERVSLIKYKNTPEIKKDETKKSVEMLETKIKTSISEVNKINSMKQMSFFKSIRTHNFEVVSNIYWYYQKRLQNG